MVDILNLWSVEEGDWTLTLATQVQTLFKKDVVDHLDRLFSLEDGDHLDIFLKDRWMCWTILTFVEVAYAAWRG